MNRALRRAAAGTGHRHLGMASLLVLQLLVAGCGSAPPTAAPPAGAAAPAAPPAAPAAPAAGDSLASFERRQLDAADRARQQGRLADAALAWEVLTLLRPQHAGYRDQLARVRAQIDAALADRLAKATAAHKRGDTDGATQHYLAALALAPAHEAAADALRALERERQKRATLRLARDPLARRGNGEPDPRVHATSTRPAMTPSAPAGPANGAGATGARTAKPAVAASAAR